MNKQQFPDLSLTFEEVLWAWNYCSKAQHEVGQQLADKLYTHITRHLRNDSNE